MIQIRLGIVGAGLIGQVEHIPNVLRLPKYFQLVGVADASPKMRAELERRGITVFASYQALLDSGIEAILIAAPDQFHAEITLAALERGIHVFCEKPLCFSAPQAREIAAARDRAGKVVQVGYMKRFDPSYETLLTLLPTHPVGLRMISVEVQDPDFWPFNQHQGEFVTPDDVPASLIEEGKRKREQQVRRATGRDLSPAELWGFTNSYCSSLIHDINAVHGMLDQMGSGTDEVVGAAFFARGDGGHGSVRLTGADALWQMTHLFVPKVADYRERITLYFDDRVFELTFPSPYLNHFPTRLTMSQSDGHVWRATDIRTSYEEPFVRELVAFWHCVREGAPVRNTIEDATRDLAFVAALAAAALGESGTASRRDARTM
jgi:predicted dehydrogenase